MHYITMNKGNGIEFFPALENIIYIYFFFFFFFFFQFTCISTIREQCTFDKSSCKQKHLSDLEPYIT